MMGRPELERRSSLQRQCEDYDAARGRVRCKCSSARCTLCHPQAHPPKRPPGASLTSLDNLRRAMAHPLLPDAQEAVLLATWGVESHSASSPEGMVRQAPLEIAPVPQQRRSGIVRSQVLRACSSFVPS